MPRIINTQKGSTNEHIARAIFSKFCFLGTSVMSHDDIGVDLFCTVFIKRNPFLIPTKSFSLQIKSNNKDVDITTNIDFFNSLSHPYFVAVVQKDKVRVYSGEVIPHFLTLYTNPTELCNPYYHKENKISIRLCDEYTNRAQLCEYKRESNKFVMNFPFITELEVNVNYDSENEQIKELIKVSTLIQKNIALKESNCFIYELYGGGHVIYTGPNSVQTSEPYFLKSFEQLLHNLNFVLDKKPNCFDKKRLNTYEKIYALLEQEYKGTVELARIGLVLNLIKNKIK